MEHKNALPQSVEIPMPGSTWRISSGAIRRGRAVEGNEEERKSFLGYYLRCGIYKGTVEGNGKKGTEKPYEKLEIDLSTSEGLVTITATLKSSTSGKPTYTACLSLARLILAAKQGDIIQITAAKSAKPNAQGSFSTYVIGHKVTLDEATGEWKATRLRDNYDPNDTRDVVEKLNDELAVVVAKREFGPRVTDAPDADEDPFVGLAD